MDAEGGARPDVSQAGKQDDGDSWTFLTVEDADNDALSEGPAYAFSVTHSSHSKGPITVHYRSLSSEHDVREQASVLRQNLMTPASPLQNSIQFMFLRDSLPETLYNELCEEVNPSWTPLPFQATAGYATLRKLEWSRDRDEPARRHAEAGTPLNSTYDVFVPGFFNDNALTAHYPESKATLVLIRVPEATMVMPNLTRLLLERKGELPLNSPDQLAHPLAGPMLVCGLVSMSVETSTSSITTVDSVLKDAGYHFYADSQRQDPRLLLPGQLAQYTADMVAASTDTYQDVGILRGLLSMLKYLGDENEKLDAWSVQGTPQRSMSQLKAFDWLRDMQLRTENMEAYRASLSTQTNVVIQGLQNVISQKNQEETKRIANESRRLAEASWKDTTSMTAITLITMIFLPATFMATLFSANFVEQVAYGGDGKRQAIAYLSITFPLTLTVLAGWYGWTYFRRRRAATILKRRETLEAMEEREEREESEKSD